MTDIAQAADILIRVRQGAAKAAGLGAAAPCTEAEAWAVQREVLARQGGSIGGYKCATPPGKPHSAAILALSGMRAGPCNWAVGASGKIGIETEIAFRIGRDLPPRATPYTKAEVLDAVAGVFPAIELIQTRFVDSAAVSGLEAMADSVSHEGFVYGADVPNWRDLDLKSLKVRQTCAGEIMVERDGGNPSGDPLVPLVWLANHLPQYGLHLTAGQIVTTGSCTGMTMVASHQRVTGGFERLGEVSVDLA
jgi:2-keto-4-pentenoate hydratase